MTSESKKHLSQQARLILQQIAAGRADEEILANSENITRQDIADAAKEALALLKPPTSYTERRDKIREQHSNFMARWTEEDEAALAEYFNQGVTVEIIALRLERHPK